MDLLFQLGWQHVALAAIIGFLVWKRAIRIPWFSRKKER